MADHPTEFPPLEDSSEVKILVGRWLHSKMIISRMTIFDVEGWKKHPFVPVANLFMVTSKGVVLSMTKGRR